MTSSNDPNMTVGPASVPQGPVFSIEKLYVKDLSVEVPRAPECFLEQTAPTIKVELGTSARRLDDAHVEVVLNTTVTATVEDRPLFLIELAYGGVFQARNIGDSDIEPLLFIACPSILYPFAREVVADAATRAGFQPVLLAPVNFEALYLQQRQQAAMAEAPSEPQ